MSRVHVTVELHGTVIEDRVIDVVDGDVLGDAEAALVHFPGELLTLRRAGTVTAVRGRHLLPGRCLHFSSAPVDSFLPAAPIPSRQFRPRPGTSIDPRLAVLTVALVLGFSWVDAAYRALSHRPDFTARAAEVLPARAVAAFSWMADAPDETAEAPSSRPDEAPASPWTPSVQFTE